MALHTFVAGDVLEAQQLNDSFAAVAGMTLISTTTIGTTVSSVTVTNAFSADYDNYRIIVSDGVASTSNFLLLTFGATVTGYGSLRTGGTLGSATPFTGSDNYNTTTDITAAAGSVNFLNGVIDVLCPFKTKNTVVYAQMAQLVSSGLVRSVIGALANTTSYTDFTLTTTTGTITGGSIRVYGYKN